MVALHGDLCPFDRQKESQWLPLTLHPQPSLHQVARGARDLFVETMKLFAGFVIAEKQRSTNSVGVGQVSAVSRSPLLLPRSLSRNARWPSQQGTHKKLHRVDPKMITAPIESFHSPTPRD